LILDAMTSYYSTFVPGLAGPVRDALLQSLKHCRIGLEMDGLIAYESDASIAAIQNLGFVTNTFRVIKSFPLDVNRSIEDMALQVLAMRKLDVSAVSGNGPQPKTFRVITSVANRLVPLDEQVMKRLESRISSQTKMRPNRSKPDQEFWFLQRSEGFGFFAARVSRHKSYEKLLQKGELRPELANILCRLSEPSPSELFLDPFCGSGAIPIQRTRFPAGVILASDNDRPKIDSLKQRIGKLGLKNKIVVRCDNALELPRYEAGSIHKIVTDPPWGHFEATNVPIERFYDRMLDEFCRVLGKEGRAVVLTAEKALFESCIEKHASQLEVLKRLDILLSGKKAGIYVMLRK
jgi:tRNA (guanine6-N2)-methyltransferase